MATLPGLPLQGLPELVRESHLEATFYPNAEVPSETTHLVYDKTTGPQQEKWIRQKMLGSGGFGIVWLEKRDPDSPAAYDFRAVKQLNIAKTESKLRDCVRELEALTRFSQAKYSRFFVKSYGWFQSPSALFLAMEYCELGDLDNYVKKHGKLAEYQVQDIGWQILQGLRFMHDKKFAHRDLKPANVLIKSKPPHDYWHVKICDLGLSKRIGTDAATTTVQGTPGLMPPELVSGIGVNPRHIDPFPADMWCLGETIFYLLTGKHTFDGVHIRLYEYCRGGPFPKEPLFHVRASDAAIRFVQELMAPFSTQRLTVETAKKHEWMRMEPLPKAEQETRETSEGREDSSTMIPGDKASGRWTTISHQQSPEIPSGRGDTTMTEIPPRREDLSTMIPGDKASGRWTTISHRRSPAFLSGQRDLTMTEISPSRTLRSPQNNNAEPSSSRQGPKRATDTSTQRTDDEISPFDQSERWLRPRFEEPATVHRRDMDYKPRRSAMSRFFEKFVASGEMHPFH